MRYLNLCGIAGHGLQAIVDDDIFELIKNDFWGLSGKARNPVVISRKRGLLHKLISPAPDGMVTTFLDGDGLNLQRANLVHVTRGMAIKMGQERGRDTSVEAVTKREMILKRAEKIQERLDNGRVAKKELEAHIKRMIRTELKSDFVGGTCRVIPIATRHKMVKGNLGYFGFVIDNEDYVRVKPFRWYLAKMGTPMLTRYEGDHVEIPITELLPHTKNYPWDKFDGTKIIDLRRKNIDVSF